MYDALLPGDALRRRSWLPQADGYVNVTGRSLRPAALEPRRPALYRQMFHPQEHRLFAGAAESGHHSPLERQMFRARGGRYGEYRDWQDIDAWAESVARQLGPAARPFASAAGRSDSAGGRSVPGGPRPTGVEWNRGDARTAGRMP